jgi:hypothetical protein
MTDDYLWHRKGEDPDIAALERQLGGLAYRGELPNQLPAQLPALLPPQLPRPRRGLWLAAAAVLLATVGALIATQPIVREPIAVVTPPPTPAPAPVVAPAPAKPHGWALSGVVGETRCDGASTGAACQLDVGETIEADARLHLAVADIGSMELEPHTRLGLLATGANEHRLKLERGTIHATVVAPPRLLVVETAATTAVDLGCSYTLSVDEQGAGFLEVDTGWVALEVPGRAVHVPAGARAETRPGRGPGVPYFTDAPDRVKSAAQTLSFATGPNSQLLAAALKAARPRDSLSLWHLLPQVTPAERAKIIKRIAVLVPDTPADLRTDDLLRLDPDALERLRQHIEPSWS